MKPRVKPLAAAALLCVGSALLAPGITQASDLNQWVQQLAGQGYGVSQGSAYVMSSCAPLVAVFGSCAGNNPNTPYVIPEPPVGSEYVDPYYGNPFTNTVDGTPVNFIYRLADTDAMVTVVNLPPTAAYFGYQSYVFTRSLGEYPRKKHAKNVSPDPQRLNIGASVGNDINNAVVANQLGSVWSAGQAVYITTANQALAQSLQASATAAGSAARVFVEPLGSNVDPGLDSGADDFATLIRYTLPENSADGAAWLAGVTSNVQVYRVSAPGTTVTRYGAPVYTTKQPVTEIKQYDAAVKELASLLKSWLASAQGSAKVVPLVQDEYLGSDGKLRGLVGDNCLANGWNCYGDDQDTDSYRLAEVGKLTAGESALVAGVNHAALNYASYISLSFYEAASSTGFGSLVQTDASAVGFSDGTLGGSAATALQYLGLYQKASSNLIDKLPQLYVAMISRQCPSGQSWCLPVSTSEISYDTSISVIHRAYLMPGTTTGADPDDVVTPQLIR